MLHAYADLPFPRTTVPHQTEVLDGHDTADTLDERRRQRPRPGSRGTFPLSIDRLTRDVSVARWGVAMADRLPVDQPPPLPRSPFDQLARAKRSASRVLGCPLTSSPQVLG
jgi:hypothetical protein